MQEASLKSEMPKPQQYVDELVATRYAEMVEKQIAWLTAENERLNQRVLVHFESRAHLLRLRVMVRGSGA